MRFLERVLAALYFTTFAPAAIEKFLEGGAPEWFIKTFAATPLGWIPGFVASSYLGIAFVEAVIAILMLLAIVCSARPTADRYLSWGLVLSAALFVALSLGQRLAHQYAEAGLLFVEAATTVLLAARFGMSSRET